MKTNTYTFKRAPTVSCGRPQAIAAFVNGSTLGEEETIELLRGWIDGLDAAEGEQGDAFRAAIAGASEVVITLAEPPPPPAPPAMVTVAMQADDAVVLAQLARASAARTDGILLADKVQSAQFTRIADTLEAAAPVAKDARAIVAVDAAAAS